MRRGYPQRPNDGSTVKFGLSEAYRFNMKSLMIWLFVLIFSVSLYGQGRFKLTDASKFVDVQIDVNKCDQYSTCGPMYVSFFHKGRSTRFQTIRLRKTQMWDRIPKANVINRYDDQSVINFGDFNFDGVDDVAICDGSDGGYGMPSYRVYLFSKTKHRFVYSRSFTRMNYGGLGMFETNRRKKMHFVFTKSGCCWHQMQGFDVYRGVPRKIYEFTEDAAYGDGSIVEITTEKLIHGKWRTWIKHVKFEDYYHE